MTRFGAEAALPGGTQQQLAAKSRSLHCGPAARRGLKQDSPVFYSGTGFHKLCGGSTVIEKVPSRPDKPPGQAITGCDHCGRPFVFSIALNGLKVVEEEEVEVEEQ